MGKGIPATGEYNSATLKTNIIVTKQVLSIIINRESKEQSYARFEAQLQSRNHISNNDIAELWEEMRNETDPELLKAIRKDIGKAKPEDEKANEAANFVQRYGKAGEWKSHNQAISETGYIDKLKVAKAVGLRYTELVSLKQSAGVEYNEIPSYEKLEAGYAAHIEQQQNEKGEEAELVHR